MATDDESTARRAIVKRRWEIIPRRGGRAVILAAVGAIALGSAPTGTDSGQAGAQGDDPAEIVAGPDDDQR
jgi:hypothetical protein